MRVVFEGERRGLGADIHAEAFQIARGGLGITVHAGEMAGPESIDTGIKAAQPARIGHGLNLIQDCEVVNGRITELGPTARIVRDGGLVLEVCVTSNSCLGTPVIKHPVRMYYEAGIAVSVNPDDRAITTTTTALEYEVWREVHGFNDEEFREINMRALEAAFCDEATKARLRPVVAAGWS